ncbi:MAG TPA: DUF2147 domain-containing protein [Burkholderiaceae bacterium]|nr:DUF2147 domain-containing protein [Burkholderiaceae bacterium]
MTIRIRALAAALGLALAAGLAHAQATPAGLWKTIDDETRQEKSLVRISEAGGVFTGKIEKLLDPAKQAAVCDQCSDERKGQPILGLTIIKGVKAGGEPGRFEGGEILDPNDGKTYKVRMTPADGGKKLEVRGYIGAPLLGRTQTWTRVE